MKRYKKFLFSRIVMTIFMLVVQVLYYIVLLGLVAEQYRVINVVMDIIAVFFVTYLLNSRHAPLEYKAGWMLLILVVPVFGVPFYIFFGDKREGRGYDKRVLLAKNKYDRYMNQNSTVMNELETKNIRAAGTAKYLMNSMNFPVYKNTEVTYYPTGEKLFEGMLEALRSAEHFIFMEYFVIEQAEVWDRVLEILLQKAEEGVEIKIIYDDFGCVAYLPHNYSKILEGMHHNIKCCRFNRIFPIVSLLLNNRDHRKMMIIDGHTSFTGGLNLSDRYININSPYGRWKDAGVKLYGEATWSMTMMFLTMWDTVRSKDKKLYESETLRTKLAENYMPHTFVDDAFSGSGYVQPFGDDPFDDLPLSEGVYMDVCSMAEKYLYISTPYLIMSEELTDTICIAAKRGVDVRIITPGIPDKSVIYRVTRSSYKRLYEAGVEIYEYTPGFIHSKCLVSDDKKAIVGTINLDYRSLFLHFEDAVFMYDTPAVLDVKKDMKKTFRVSKKISPEDVRTSIWGSLVNSVLRIFAPLM